MDSTNYPLISVITPSLNQGQYLEECIQSVISQHYPRVEYMLIDGGSKDNSLEIIHRYKNYFTYWISEPDKGQSEAINKGFKRATGDLVAWINADDYFLPKAFDTIAQAYQANKDASFYYGNGLRVKEDVDRSEEFYPGQVRDFNLDAIIHGLNYILQPTTFISRKHLDQAGHLDTGLHYGLDTDLWIRLAKIAPPQSINAFLAASREYGQTKTSTGSFRRIEELRQVAERHSGLPMTPGVLCYFLDTLCRFAMEHPEMYPKSYVDEINRFWGSTAQLLAMYHARPDGSPMTSDELQAYQLQKSEAAQTTILQAARRYYHRLVGRLKRAGGTK